MNNISLDKIIIPKSFTESNPKKYKIDKASMYYLLHGKLDKPLVVKSENNLTLVDNYTRYIVAKENNIDTVQYVTLNEYNQGVDNVNHTQCIVGVFDCNPKEYTWKNNNGLSVKIGDKVLVMVKKNHREQYATITVTDVYMSNSKKAHKHKPVIKVVNDIKE